MSDALWAYSQGLGEELAGKIIMIGIVAQNYGNSGIVSIESITFREWLENQDYKDILLLARGLVQQHGKVGHLRDLNRNHQRGIRKYQIY